MFKAVRGDYKSLDKFSSPSFSVYFRDIVAGELSCQTSSHIKLNGLCRNSVRYNAGKIQCSQAVIHLNICMTKV